jgi:hypothetical protein
VPQHLLATLTRNPDLSSLNILGWITLKALAAWMVTVLPMALLAYGILMTTVFRKSVQVSLVRNIHE